LFHVKQFAPAIQMRNAILADAPVLARHIGVLGYPTTHSAMEHRLGTILPRPDQHIVVADVDRQVRGGAALQRDLSREADGSNACLTARVVDDGAQGTAIGTALVNETERWATELGASVVTLTSAHH
jgi:GNAT superfamily N-acetyltransferase